MNMNVDTVIIVNRLNFIKSNLESMDSEFGVLSQFKVDGILGQGSHLASPQVNMRPTSLEEYAGES